MARALLQRVHLSSTFRHRTLVQALAPNSVNTRVFLAGYMIAYRPTHVFESMGALEQGLFEAAGPVLESFQSIIDAVHNSPTRDFQSVPSALTRDFTGLLFEFLDRFKAWKIPDEKRLTCRIKHALIALYRAEGHLPEGEPLDSPIRIEITTQIERLRTKLGKISGPEALEQFDRERSVVMPGCSGPTGGGAGGGGPLDEPGSGGASTKVTGCSLTKVSAASVGSSAGAALCLSNVVRPSQLGRASNEQLAHELLLDSKFQLNQFGGYGAEDPVFQRIRQSFHVAFWDSLVDDLRLETPCYARVLHAVGEIRDGVRNLGDPQNSCNIVEAVDTDLIRLQAEKGLYGWQDCVRLVTVIFGIVQQVQSTRCACKDCSV